MIPMRRQSLSGATHITSKKENHNAYVMIILVLILIGIAAGYTLRRIKILKKVNRTISITIGTMVFLLGMTVGNNHELLGNIGNYGWQALLICCAGLAGSILFTITINAIFFKNTSHNKEGGHNE